MTPVTSPYKALPYEIKEVLFREYLNAQDHNDPARARDELVAMDETTLAEHLVALDLIG